MTSIVSIVGVVLNGKENIKSGLERLKVPLILMICGKFVKARRIVMENKLHESHLIVRSNVKFDRQKTTRHMH